MQSSLNNPLNVFQVKALKQRIKEELQIATATRRLLLDEAEEVHRMELALSERDKERRIRAQRESRDEAWQKDQLKQAEADRFELEKLIRKRHNAIAESASKYSLKNALRMSQQNQLLQPQQLSGTKHRRQNSDPLASKAFSPIDEDLDLENWLRRYGLSGVGASGSGKYSPQLMSSSSLKKFRTTSTAAVDSGSVAKRWDLPDDGYRNFGGTLPLQRKTAGGGDWSSSSLQNHKLLSRSSEMLSMLDRHANLIVSQSESSLPLTMQPSLTSRTPTYFSDGDEGGGVTDARIREERKLQLQMEIGLRKLQLEETQYLQNELRKLAEMPDITPVEMDKARSLYQQRIKMREQVGGLYASQAPRPLDPTV